MMPIPNAAYSPNSAVKPAAAIATEEAISFTCHTIDGRCDKSAKTTRHRWRAPNRLQFQLPTDPCAHDTGIHATSGDQVANSLASTRVAHGRGDPPAVRLSVRRFAAAWPFSWLWWPFSCRRYYVEPLIDWLFCGGRQR